MSYSDGFLRGCRDAREVLVLQSALWARYDVADLPADIRERAHWLNGYAAGVRHIAMQVATGVPVGQLTRPALGEPASEGT